MWSYIVYFNLINYKMPMGIELLEKGFKVLRLWEREINAMNLTKFKDLLKLD